MHMSNPRRKPFKDPFEATRAMDRAALAQMQSTGCSFSEAWKRLLTAEQEEFKLTPSPTAKPNSTRRPPR